MKKPDKESDTLGIVVFKSFAIASKPGRYISMEKGPRAANEPNTRMR